MPADIPRSLTSRLRLWPRRRPAGRIAGPPIVPLAILVVFAFAAVFAEWVAPGDPFRQALRFGFKPPVWLDGGRWMNLLGTDRLGRDLLTRMIYGARISLTAGVVTVAVATFVGVAVGLIAAYFRGRVDAVLMQLTDATLSIPIILVALILAVTVGPSFQNVVLAIAAILWARYARVIRGEALSLMERDFIALARVAGCSPARIIAVHLFPNILNTVVVLFTLQVGDVIIVEAALSFLGAGIPPPTPAWGSMVAEGREFITTAWWVSFFPGLAILLVVLSFNLLGDWLRDRLDPKLRQI